MNKIFYWCIGAFLVVLMVVCSMLGGIYQKKEEQGFYYGTNEWMWPVPEERNISSYFGKRESPTKGASTEHKGIDIPCQEGCNIVATKDGVVEVAAFSSAEGNYIVIKHDDTYESVYMHCMTLLVAKGDSVSRGQVIALSGNTGVSTGPHCHFGIKQNGTYVDPLEYVDLNEEIQYSTTATTKTRYEMIEYAKQFLGNPYVYGGTSLTNGVDCSGFTMRIYEHFNISLPRSAQEQYNAAEHISRDELLPGDLVFYGTSSQSISHVSMYMGYDQVIHASNKVDGIKISSFSYRTPVGYGRFLTADYTDEDLKYLAAVIAGEALPNSKEGQYAVGYVVLNRVNSNGFGDSIKMVVSAPGQFTSPWASHLSNPPEWALEAAQAILEGSAPNPIGTKCYFISASYATKKGIDDKGINVGGNIFYDECIW